MPLSANRVSWTKHREQDIEVLEGTRKTSVDLLDKYDKILKHIRTNNFELFFPLESVPSRLNSFGSLPISSKKKKIITK